MQATDIADRIRASIAVKERLLADESFRGRIQDAAETMVTAFRMGAKVLFCGNGGSAADAQHLAAELSGRFYRDRDPLWAEALHVNTSFLTAVANDYGYDAAYARAVQAQGRTGDILVAISTSGNSTNVLEALKMARTHHLTIVGMTGASGGEMANRCDILLNVPSDDTPRIQECHILIGHILCEYVEAQMFS
ncbi:MAG: D-sedoheptulose 7-phosphate isomerase [Bacteroidota bacterium]